MSKGTAGRERRSWGTIVPKGLDGGESLQRRSVSVGFRCALRTIAAVAIIGWSGAARADDFQVNAYTYYDQKFPDMCSDSSGNFVVVWESYYQDNAGWGIFGRLFDSTFSPIGNEFQVNTGTAGDQGGYYSGPAVACDDNLNFVVVWPSTYPFDLVWGRQFDNLGIPAGTAFVVNSYNNYNYPGYNNIDVAMNPSNGNFVVVWDSYYQDGDGLGVFGQRFASNGAATGTEFQVNTYTYYNQGGNYKDSDIEVAMDPAGRFVVVWGSAYQDGYGEGVFGRQFNSAGVGASEFQVNTYTYSYQGAALGVAKDATGKFVVVWTSYYQDGYGNGVFGQRFTSLGSRAGAEFQVNTYTYADQGGYRYVGDGVAVGYEPGGAFEVAWASDDQDGYYWGIFAQRYTSSGAPSGTEFQVNTYTYYRQDHPSVAGHGPGEFVVAWQSYYQDYDRIGIFVNGPNAPPTATPTPTPPDCPATPVGSCATPGKGKLLIKDKDPAGASAKDKIIYKWLKGPAFNQSDFGDPVSGGTDIFICIYDNTGRVAKLEAPAGSLWQPLGSSGYSYKDTSLANDGLQKVLLKGGGAGKSKIIVKAKDGNISMPGLPLDVSTNVTVQVHRSDGGPCWQTVMAGAGSTNTATQFKGQFP